MLGNLNSKRDWGHAKDFVNAQWLLLQQDMPIDLVIKNRQQHSIREFVDTVAMLLDMKIEWEGEGLNERAYWKNSPFKQNNPIILVDKKYFRPTEVDTLLGDASQARNKLNWEPKFTFKELVQEMVFHDIHLLESKGK